VPEEEYTIPFGVADIKREGNDITVVANSLMLHGAINMADRLEKERGIQVEVIDPRCLVPLDMDTIVASVEKTGRILIVEESNRRGGWGAEVAAEVAARAVGYLDAPILRIAAPDVPVPFSPTLESHIIPDEGQIYRKIIELVEGREAVYAD
jgi:pyruvate dehydrogenase E1 component beta subunit